MFGKIYQTILAIAFCGLTLAVFDAQIEAQICTPAPVGLASIYSGDGNALDARSRINGTLQGGATYAAGKVGQAFSLNGTDAFVQAPSSPANDPTTAGSLEAWVRFNQLPSAAGHVMEIIGKGGGGTDFDLQAEPDNRIRFYVAGSNNVASTTVVQTGVWYFVVGAWDSTDGLKLYVNGALENTNTAQVTRGASNQPLQIGNQPTFGPRLFSGLIDEASIYNRALTAAEVQSIYNSDTAGKCKPVATNAPNNQVLWLAGDGDARDSAGTNNGTLQNGATFAVGKVGQTFSFDGVDDYVSTAAFSTGTQATIETWVNPSILTGGFQDGTLPGINRRTIGGFVADCNDFGVGLYNGSIGVVYKPANGNCTALAPASAVTVQTNQWYHVAATIDGATVKLYVNGVLQASAATAANYTPTDKFRLGAAQCCSGDTFGGKIDEFSLYSRALSVDEIMSIVNADLAGKLKQTTTTGTTATVGDATVTFAAATSTTTRETPLDAAKLPALPANATSTGLVYDVATSAAFSGSAQVCFNLPISTAPFNTAANFANLKVLHLESGVWVDRTSSRDFSTRTLCAQTPTLSPFAIVSSPSAPTAAEVTVSGRVANYRGRGISGAIVRMTDGGGVVRWARTTSFGYYRFDNVASGETYVFTVKAKRYEFGQPTLVLYVGADEGSVNFSAAP